MDTELITPAINLGDYDLVYLSFNLDFLYDAGKEDFIEVEVSTNGVPGPWELAWDAPTLLYPRPASTNADQADDQTITDIRTGAFMGPRTITVELTDHAANETNVMIRFRYFDASNAFHCALDNVKVYGNISLANATNDSNGNAIPDWWEETYFGSPTGCNAGEDEDDDGFSNKQEYTAGTMPCDAGSLPEILCFDRIAQGQNISFLSEPRRIYALAYETPLQTWVTIQSGIEGTGEILAIPDTPRVNHRRYRLEVKYQNKVPGKLDPVYAYGTLSELPMSSDFDADGKDDLAVISVADGKWYIKGSAGGYVMGQAWGSGIMQQVPADYDGDGKGDLSVYDTLTGSWYIRFSSGGALFGDKWGWQGAVPVLWTYH